MAQRPTLEVVSGGSDNSTTPLSERGVSRNVHSLSNARTLAIGSGVDPSRPATGRAEAAQPEKVNSANGPLPYAVDRADKALTMRPPEGRSVLLGEVFDHCSEPLWPMGGVLTLRLAMAIESLRDGHDVTEVEGGLARITLFESGDVSVEGEYPGDARAVTLVATWLYRFATGTFPMSEGDSRPSRVNPNLPSWVDEVCTRALSTDGVPSYTSLREFITALEEQNLDVPPLEIVKLVRAVSSYLYPSAEELAGELGDALRIFTLPPPSTRKPRRLLPKILIAATVIVVCVLVVWRTVLNG